MTQKNEFIVIIEVPTQQVQHVSCRIIKHAITQCSVLSTVHCTGSMTACAIAMERMTNALVDTMKKCLWR